MNVIVDLLESDVWLETSTWPSWLTSTWLSEQDALLICRLTDPDHLTDLRALVTCPERLLAYPNYNALQQHLSKADRDTVHSVFLQCFEASHYLTLTPESKHPTSLAPLTPTYQRRTQQTQKAQLAFVSPLPPTASGISGYCAEILPHLEQYYDITLVVIDPGCIDAELAEKFEIISHKQMMREGSRFDRIMYHFGNSSFHYEYFLLLQAHPGIVVLHDTYLGDCIFSNHAQFGSTELSQTIYASHGWSAMPDCDGPVKQAINLYPACASVFSGSYGVVVHNRFASEILSQSFSNEMLSTLSEIPLARKLKPLVDKSSARKILGIAEDITLYSTFGMINLNKCLVELMDGWVSSGLANDPSVKLCFVGGGNHNWEMENKIEAWISKLPDPQQVTLTGYVDAEQYDLYLSASDVAIQLRRNSRGESSAALLDCMGAGLATIINAHGSMAEIPDETAFKLSDDFTVSELAQSLASAAVDRPAREAIGQKARAHIKNHHSPEHVSAAYREHMEARYQQSPDVLIDQMQSDVLGPKVHELSADTLYSCSEALNDLMRCAGVRRTVLAGTQLLIDVSALVQNDSKQGAQRIVRNVLRELLQNHYLGYRVEPVYYDLETACFRYARTFTNHFLGLPPLYLSDDPVEALPGDIYLGLDFCHDAVVHDAPRQFLQYWRGRGVSICHVVYDLLPITLPEYFSVAETTLHSNWLELISQISDSIVCTSVSVMNEYRLWLEQQPFKNAPQIRNFQLGADMGSQSTDDTLSAAEQKRLTELQQPYLLMVGPISQQKGHQQVLAAFQELQQQGCTLSLVIAGGADTADHQLIDKLKHLTGDSSSIYWLDCVSDSMLKALYQQSAGTLMASYGEGFCLPLLEAAYYGSPLIARNLPVFRELCGESAWYFESTDAKGLAGEIQSWLTAYHDAVLPDSSWMQSINWNQSAVQLMDSITPPALDANALARNNEALSLTTGTLPNRVNFNG